LDPAAPWRSLGGAGANPARTKTGTGTGDKTMKITAASIHVVPTGWRRAVIVELETDAGITGCGEVGIAYGAGVRAAAAMAEEMAERFLLGRDPSPVERIWSDIYDQGFWTKGGGAIPIAALSGLEQALWDIKGKALGQPVFALMGGPITPDLAVYANGWWAGAADDRALAEAGAAMVARGFTRLKFYPLGLPDPETVVRHPARRASDADIGARVRDRIERLRDRAGAAVEVLLDFGGGLTLDQLLRVFDRIADLDILFVEEPVDPAIPGALADLGRRSRVPIAAGERVFTRYGFQTLLAGGAVQIVQPDVCNTGGIAEARRIAALAEIHNLRVAPHNYGSALATAAAAQAAAVMPNFMLLEVFPDHAAEPGYRPVVAEPLEARLRAGALPLPEGPGLGVSLAPGLEAFRVARVTA
jgi:galactonate dehydratase